MKQYVTHVRASGIVGGVRRYAAHELEGDARKFSRSGRGKTHRRKKFLVFDSRREAERARAVVLFRRKFGVEPDAVSFMGYVKEDGTVTDKELAGLLMEQEHDMAEHDQDSECPGDTPCVQCPPKSEEK